MPYSCAKSSLIESKINEPVPETENLLNLYKPFKTLEEIFFHLLILKRKEK